MNEDRKKRGLANGKFFTAVAICALFLGSGNVMAAQTASNDSQGVQEQMQSISVTVTVVDTKVTICAMSLRRYDQWWYYGFGWSFQIKCKARCYSASIICGIYYSRSQGNFGNEGCFER